MPEDLEMGHTISVSASSPWVGVYHALQLHPGSCCEPPHSLHGLCNVQKSPIAPPLNGLDPSFEFCWHGPALTGIEESR